jgi:hypothetical protein
LSRPAISSAAKASTTARGPSGAIGSAVTVGVGSARPATSPPRGAVGADADLTLTTAAFSLVFGQGRSDHASFVAGGVASVFFTDANTSCYHTTGDDVAVVDFAKLDQQIATGLALVTDLADADTPPVFDAEAPVTTFADAVTMHGVMSRAEPDFALFGDAAAETAGTFLTRLDEIVGAGEAAFDDAAAGALLGGSAQIVELLTTGDCTAHS